MDVFSDLELQFSPSFWSKRFDAKGVIENHIKFAVEESNRARNSIPCRLNIPYGKLQCQKFDLYGSDLPSDAPIFVFIHGGYWQELNKDLSSYVAHSFYEKRFKSIIVDYTLCPATTLEDIVVEIQIAFKAIVNYAIASKSFGIYIAGHSAGAHLLACLLKNGIPNLRPEELHYIKFVTLISGVYDLTPLIETYINDKLQLNENSALKLSPLYFNYIQNAYDFTVKVVVGEYESAEFKNQSKQFYYKLKYFLKNVTFLELERLDHFDIVENFNSTDYELFKLIISI